MLSPPSPLFSPRLESALRRAGAACRADSQRLRPAVSDPPGRRGDDFGSPGLRRAHGDRRPFARRGRGYRGHARRDRRGVRPGRLGDRGGLLGGEARPLRCPEAVGRSQTRPPGGAEGCPRRVAGRGPGGQAAQPPEHPGRPRRGSDVWSRFNASRDRVVANYRAFIDALGAGGAATGAPGGGVPGRPGGDRGKKKTRGRRGIDPPGDDDKMSVSVPCPHAGPARVRPT